MKWMLVFTRRQQLFIVAACFAFVPLGYFVGSAVASRVWDSSSANPWRPAVGYAFPPPRRIDPLSTFTNADSLLVRFHSTGCFHNATYEITFRKDSELTASIVQLVADRDLPPIVAEQTDRVEIGTLTLSPSDIAGLDKLFEFYNNHSAEIDTTCVDYIEFTQQRNSETVTTKSVTDSSCGLHEIQGLTTFHELIERASQTDE